MGKLKSAFIAAAAAAVFVLTGTSTPAGEMLRGAAYFSLNSQTSDIPSEGVSEGSSEASEALETSEISESSEASEALEALESEPAENPDEADVLIPVIVPDVSITADDNGSSDIPDLPDFAELPDDDDNIESADSAEDIPQSVLEETVRGTVITLDRSSDKDDIDRSQYSKNSGAIRRLTFGHTSGAEMITLPSGAQLRNCTYEDNEDILEICGALPELGSFDGFELGSEQPQVLIYHTHSSESFLPFGDSYDYEYPLHTTDPEQNIIAVGDAVCEALASRGISVVHDCAVHDSPLFTGAYYRSAETLLRDLKEHPTIKLAIDIHRDGIINADGSVTAPTVEINGKSAAQFMIITGCDSESSPLPEYRTNLKAACLIQNCAEEKYPGLARAILFDYRSYNQPLFAGNLLIEVGSQGNSLEEAVITGGFLGDAIVDGILRLADGE